MTLNHSQQVDLKIVSNLIHKRPVVAELKSEVPREEGKNVLFKPIGHESECLHNLTIVYYKG